MRVRLSALAALVAMAAACQTAAAPAPQEITIASDLPFNATYAPDAYQASEAIQLAVAEHARVGSFKLSYLPLDDGPTALLTPVRGVQNVRRMIAGSQVLGEVGPFNSSGAVEMIPVANAASFAMVSEAVTNWCVTLPNQLCNPQPSELRASGPNNFFRIAAPDSVEGRAIARYMAKTLKLLHVAVFTLSNDFDDVTVSQFEDEFARDGGDMVFSRSLPAETVNFAPFLKAARAHGADAVFAATQSDVCQARAQMKGIFPPGSYFIGMDGQQENPMCIQEAGDSADGMLATVSVLDMENSRDPAVMKIAKDFRRAFPKSSPISPYAFAAYDCALILIDAITRAVNENNGRFPTRAQVVDLIAHTAVRGAIGTYTFDKNGDAVSPLMALYQVKGASWVYVSQIDASAASS